MRPDEITVEVRNRNLRRMGQILPRDLDFKAKLRWCGVGEWTITLPGDSPMVPHLRTPGSGILVTGPIPGGRGSIFSGPTNLPKRVRNLKNPDGTYTFTGVTDDILLDEALAYPDPQTSGNPATQTKTNDVRTGKAETLMRQYVAYNIANGAARPAADGGPTAWALADRLDGLRNYLVLDGADQNRGSTQTKSPRFQNLLELLQEIAVYDGDYGFRTVQYGGLLKFQVVPVVDRRGTVRLDISNGTVTSEETSEQGATLTHAIVAGQGDGTARQTIVRTNTADLSTWGRRTERFFDRRDTNDTTILQQKGDEELTAARGGTSAKIIPADALTMRFLVDFNVGDWITVVVDGQERDSVVTEAVLIANSKTTSWGIAIGDVSSFDPRDSQARKQDAIDSRVGYLERNLSAGWLAGDIKETARTTAPEGWLMCDGSVKDRADYPVLFQAIGTTYNTGGETAAQFRLPSRQGRVGVGMDSTQAEFDTLGERGGEKTHTLSVAEMPSHTHTQNPHSHGGAGGGKFVQSGSGGSVANVTVGGTGYILHDAANATATNQYTGGGGAHNNLQPYVVLNYLIKT